MSCTILDIKKANKNISPVPLIRFEVGQYVRARLSAQRTEIGVITHINELDDSLTITTRHGYDLTVSRIAACRAFLVVLDINGVLGARGRGSFIHRPYVEQLLKFLFTNFVVAVWTSGLERTSKPIMESLFQGFQNRLLFTLFRDSCTDNKTKAKPYGTIKNLQKIFDVYPKSFHSVNTIIIDDSPDKCSHPDIALCPPTFSIDDDASNDESLLHVINILKKVLDLDSLSPIIRVAPSCEEQEYLSRKDETEQASSSKYSLVQESGTTPMHTLNTVSTRSGNTEATSILTESKVELCMWKKRLCCDYICGFCAYGSSCRFAHETDDGKQPCFRKNKCRRGHASRWEEACTHKQTTKLTSSQSRNSKNESNVCANKE